MTKLLLIVDNDDLTNTIEDIYDKARKKGISVECFPLQVGLPDGNDTIDENGRISMALVLDKLRNLYGNRRFHMVASDFDFNDASGIDGIKILSGLNSINNTKNSKRILYSSQLVDIVQDYLNLYKDEQDFQSAWLKFKSLIKLDIIDFILRDDVETNIVNHLEKIIEKEDDFILKELIENSDLSFNPSIEIYDGLTFKGISKNYKSYYKSNLLIF